MPAGRMTWDTRGSTPPTARGEAQAPVGAGGLALRGAPTARRRQATPARVLGRPRAPAGATHACRRCRSRSVQALPSAACAVHTCMWGGGSGPRGAPCREAQGAAPVVRARNGGEPSERAERVQHVPILREAGDSVPIARARRHSTEQVEPRTVPSVPHLSMVSRSTSFMSMATACSAARARRTPTAAHRSGGPPAAPTTLCSVSPRPVAAT